MAFSFNIRPAVPTDASGIAAAHHASIHGIGAKFYPPDIIAVWGARRDPQKYIDLMAKGEAYFIAVPNDPLGTDQIKEPHILGVSSYDRDINGHNLRRLYIRPEARGYGVADALYMAIEKLAIQNGATEILCEGSLAGEKFYERVGFRKIEYYEHPLKSAPGKSMRAVKMVKSLCP